MVQPWLIWAGLMGLGFISVFNFIAYCTKKAGITATTIANKLSFVIPVAFAIWLYQDSLGLLKVVGILLSFPAVYFTAKTKSAAPTGGHLLLLIPLFLGSGLLDTLVNYISTEFFNSGNAALDARGQAIFLTHTFACAAIIGSLLVGLSALSGHAPIHRNSLVAGLLLGIPNYFSMYFFMALLNSGFLPSSIAIPVNNIGILFTATLVAILVFKEELSIRRILGLLLSFLTITIMFFSGGK